MAQIKIYGNRSYLLPNIAAISDAIHACTVSILGLPEEKRFHRFIPLDQGCFIYPRDRTDCYLIVEVSLMSGRTTETRKAYIRAILSELVRSLKIPVSDIEVTLNESPKENWGIRGVTGDELQLNYQVEK